MTTPAQDKQKEITFFDRHAAADDYAVSGSADGEDPAFGVVEDRRREATG